MLFSGGTEFWGGVGNKNLVGVGVYWGEFYQVGGGMSKFLAGVGGLPPSLPVGKTLSFIKIYIHHVTIIVITIIIAFRVERIRDSCAQFFEHAGETFGAGMHHGKACISSAFIQKLVYQIMYLKSAFAMYKTYQLVVVQGNII